MELDAFVEHSLRNDCLTDEWIPTQAAVLVRVPMTPNDTRYLRTDLSSSSSP